MIKKIKNPPMNPNSKTFTGTIDSLSFRGLGCCRSPGGKVFFIPGSWPGDEAIIEITEEKKKHGFAKIKEIITPSPHRRTEIPCPYHGHTPQNCGGCPWLMATYDSQLEQKENILKQLIERYQIPLANGVFKKILPSSHEFHFKNRVQVKHLGSHLGFQANRSHQVIDIPECLIMNPELQEIYKELRASLKTKSASETEVYSLDDQTSLKQSLNQQQVDFRQGHSAMNAYMKNWLFERVSKESSKEAIIELFCGSGNFTETLVALSNSYLAVDSAESAIQKLNSQFPQVSAHALNLYASDTVTTLKNLSFRARMLILDPPRSGLKNIANFLEIFPRVESIFYISCDPDSWARDIASISNQFELTEIQAVDAFPHTPHFETLSSLKKI